MLSLLGLGWFQHTLGTSGLGRSSALGRTAGLLSQVAIDGVCDGRWTLIRLALALRRWALAADRGAFGKWFQPDRECFNDVRVRTSAGDVEGLAKADCKRR